ncbi:MAG TPA: hypothetical protein VFB38_05430 [Chthonomonadaceae bacterium]|nr:hypothetical protein [Chthonomonadaceae bacterium]
MTNFDASRPGPKLPPAARKLIRQRLIAGDSNDQIQAALEKEGYPRVSRQALHRYRQSRKVQEALAMMDIESVQCGLALRARRIMALAQHAQDLWQRMTGRVVGFEDMPRLPADKLSLVLLGREFRATLEAISKLVDTPAARPGLFSASSTPADEAPDTIEPALDRTFVIGQLNDALEKFLERHEREQAQAQEQAGGEG